MHVANNEEGGGTYTGEAATKRLVLEWRLTDTKRVVLRLCRNRRGRGKVVWVPAVACAAAAAFVVIRIMETLLRGLGRERQGRDIRGGRRACHDAA